MLQALYQLAHDEGLLADPDYEPKLVAWLVRVGDNGKLLGIEDTRTAPPAEGKKKPKPVARAFSIPRQPTGRSGTKAPAAFLVDNAKYVFGLPTTGKDLPAEQGREKSGWFRKLIEECYEATKDEGVKAVLKLLDKVAEGKTKIALPDDCKSNELFAFIYAPDIDKLVHERPSVRHYWKKCRQQHEDLPEATDRTCLVTGAPMGAPDLFPLIKKVPGGTTSGAGLVSFNKGKGAFTSHGWNGNENAPISRAAAEACRDALNMLLDPATPSRRHLRLSEDMAVCFWARGLRGNHFATALSGLLSVSDPQQVGDLYRSLWKGKRVSLDDTSAFYAVTLSGAQGRVVVRDWFESSVYDVASNLARHFSDLELVRNTPPPKNRELPPVLPLPVLLRSLAPFGEERGIPDPLAAQFVHAALRGTRYPLALLQKALERMRAEIGRSEWSDLERRDARAALLKAVLNRTLHVTPEILPMLDQDNHTPAYTLGRLLAIIERLQQLALGDVNASVVDRYFSAASATPRIVFTRLGKSVPHYVRKAQDEPKQRGLVFMLDRQFSELMSYLPATARDRYPANAAGFPSSLSLEEQGIFMLGYHHQKHWIWLKKEDREQLTAAAAESA